MGKWKDFKLEIPEDIKVSEYMRVDIKITTAYKYGSGWGSQEAIQNYGSGSNAANAWELEVYEKLSNAGYYIEKADMEGSCETLLESKLKGKNYRADHLDLYMHPMEFTGYATMDQLNEIVDILESCKTIDNVRVNIAERVYSMSDYLYEQVLNDNAERIVRHICEKYKPKDREYSGQIAIDFAGECRLPRANAQSSCLSSSDIDVKYITQLMNFCKMFDNAVYKKVDKELKQESMIEK